MSRRAALSLLVLTGCFTQAKLVRTLHAEREELESAESSGYSYQAPTPEVDPLRGLSHKELEEELGPGTCWPEGEGQRCAWRFFETGPESPGGPQLKVVFDRKGLATDARWEQVR